MNLHGLSLELQSPLPAPVAAWTVQIGGWVVFLGVAIYLGYRWAKAGRPSTAALLFIGCFSIFWQEFFADWGAYLYYNPELALLPWRETALTTPNKPVYVLAGYGWFYAIAFTGILLLFKWARTKWPDAPYLVVLFLTTLIPFYLWNLASADGISFLTNWYQYLHPVGPAIHTSSGALPLLYPAFPFSFFAPLVVWSLDRRGPDGRTWFVRLLKVPAGAVNKRWDASTDMLIPHDGDVALQARPAPARSALSLQLHQVAAWIVGMNLMYAATLTVPLVLIRILTLPDNPFVP